MGKGIALQFKQAFPEYFTAYQKACRANVGDAAGVSAALVNYYFVNMKEMKRAIMRRAIEQKVIEIIIQGLARRDPIARRAPKELREKALQKLMNA